MTNESPSYEATNEANPEAATSAAHASAVADETFNLEDAIAKLRSTDVTGVPAAPPPASMPQTSVQAISGHVNSIIGRAAFNAVTKSREVRKQLELFEQSIMADMERAHVVVVDHIKNGESLMKIAEYLQEQVGHMSKGGAAGPR